MLDATQLAEMIRNCFFAHDAFAKAPENRVRKFDGKTPYGVHPTWCAMSVLSEPNLSEEDRVVCAWALLYHDTKEDTGATWVARTCPPEVDALVDEMTFPGSSEDEMANLWTRSTRAKLCKLFDKTNNYFDAPRLAPEKRLRYGQHILRLADEAEKNYGPLNVIVIARALVAAANP